MNFEVEGRQDTCILLVCFLLPGEMVYNNVVLQRITKENTSSNRPTGFYEAVCVIVKER